jgi:hypothetical protein
MKSATIEIPAFLSHLKTSIVGRPIIEERFGFVRFEQLAEKLGVWLGNR